MCSKCTACSQELTQTMCGFPECLIDMSQPTPRVIDYQDMMGLLVLPHLDNHALPDLETGTDYRVMCQY